MFLKIILSPRRCRELRISICFNSRNKNSKHKNTAFCKENKLKICNCNQVLNKRKNPFFFFWQNKRKNPKCDIYSFQIYGWSTHWIHDEIYHKRETSEHRNIYSKITNNFPNLTLIKAWVCVERSKKHVPVANFRLEIASYEQSLKANLWFDVL